MLTNENIHRSNTASSELKRLCNNVNRQTENYNLLNREIASLPKFSDELSNLVAETGIVRLNFLNFAIFLMSKRVFVFTAKLEGLCEEVESALSYLEILCQTQDMEHVKLEQRFQLALYREKKMAALNDAKSKFYVFNDAIFFPRCAIFFVLSSNDFGLYEKKRR